MTSRHLAAWTALVATVGLVVVLATFRDYGVTWDEPVQSHYGEGVLRYFTSGGSDRSVDEFLHMRFYGPLFELLGAISYAAAPEAKYEIRHLLIALSGVLTLIGVIRIASLLPGRFVPIFAPLALVALPRFYGHAFNNSKDIPFACGFVWAVYAICRFVAARDTPAPWTWRVLGCGAALGATLAVRPGGMPLLLLLFGSVALASLWLRDALRWDQIRPLALGSAAVWTLAWCSMVLLWPWAHANPIVHPVEAVLAALSFPDTFPVLFQGEITRSDALPRTYLAHYLGITTPPALLLLAALGLAVGGVRLVRARRAPESVVLVAVALWLVAPLLLVMASRPNVYDGMRHLLFALPALALLAAVGAQALCDAFSRWAARTSLPGRIVGPASAAGVSLVIASCLVDHVRLHPYQSTYFNGFVGGVAGAAGRYETDYWLSSYREAMEWVNARAVERGAGDGREISVLVAADPYSRDCAAAFVGPGVRMAHTVESGLAGGLPEPFDYYLATTRYGLDGNFPDAPVAHRVGREGATFTLIRGRDPASERGLAEHRSARSARSTRSTRSP